MGFRDESEALRARVDVLERELGHAQREAERARALERELAEAKERLERLEDDRPEGDEELRAELARLRERLMEAEAKARHAPAARAEASKSRNPRALLVYVAVLMLSGGLCLVIQRRWVREPSADPEWEAPTSADWVPPIPEELPAVDPPRPPAPAPRVAPAVAPPEEDGLLRRWGTSTTPGWRHEGGRCEILVDLGETVVVTCRGEELHRGFVPCAPDYTSCATPDDDALRVDFAAGRAVIRTDEGLVAIELDPPGPE